MTRRSWSALATELLERSRGLAKEGKPAHAHWLGLRAVARHIRIRQNLPVSRSDASCTIEIPTEFHPLLDEPDCLSRVLQALNEPVLQKAYRSAGLGSRKLEPEQVAAATQLFTPLPVVRWLLRHALEPSRDCRRHVRDLLVMDPACGTMNFGVAAVDVLHRMYLDEMDRAGRRGFPSEPSVRHERDIPHAIVAGNLLGIDIDPLALWVACEALRIRLRVDLPDRAFRLHRADSLLDPEIASSFDGRCDCVVTNPPFLSARNLPPGYVGKLKRQFPNGWRDTCACFVERCMRFTRDGGRAGILAMHTFMFTGAFQPLRRSIASLAAIEQIAHFGGGVFEGGNPGTLQTAAIVLHREPSEPARLSQQVHVVRLIDSPDKLAALESPHQQDRYSISQSNMTSSPRSAWCYWLDRSQRRAFASLPRLRSIAAPRQGLATTDNDRFVRYWWEVVPTTPAAPCRASVDTWVPYVKAGRFRRWHESPRHRVNWKDDGAAIKQSICTRYPYLNGRWQWVAKNADSYFKPGITYSYLTSGRFSARLLPAGCIFDVAGSSLFPSDPLTILGILNSTCAADLLHAINPTINFQVGDLCELPIPAESDPALSILVARAVDLQRVLDAFDETAPEFRAPALPGDRDWHECVRDLRAVEAEIDLQVSRLYDLPHSPPTRSGDSSETPDDLPARWISFVTQRLLGRWGGEAEHTGFAVADSRFCRQVERRLSRCCGATVAGRFIEDVGGVERFLSMQFPLWHARLYRGRPVCWTVGVDRRVIALHDHLDEAAVAGIARLGVDVPTDWRRDIDSGISRQLAALVGSDPARVRKRRAA